MFFFLRSWEINLGDARDKSREIGRFVTASPKFISHERRKSDTHSLYLQYLPTKNFFLKAPDKFFFEILSKIVWQWPHFNELSLPTSLYFDVIL